VRARPRSEVLSELQYVTNKNILNKKCAPCDNLRSGYFLGDRLLAILREDRGAAGVGLAANQVGVDMSVCVINVVNPIILINPRIVEHSGSSFFQEACLSLPGDYIITERWTDIVVEDDHNNSLIFSFEKNALECVCVQHEIDHLNGITMLERAVDMEIFNG